MDKSIPELLDQGPESLADTYVSFADDYRFLGVVVVPGQLSLSGAVSIINKSGLNPGGEAMMFYIPYGSYPTMRLLDEDYMRSTGHYKLGELRDVDADKADEIRLIALMNSLR